MPLLTSLRATPPALRPSSTFHEALEVLELVFTQPWDLRLAHISSVDFSWYGRLAAVKGSYRFLLEQYYALKYCNG